MTQLQIRKTIAIAASLGLLWLAPQPAGAGTIHPGHTAANFHHAGNLQRIVCDRQWSNLWSCNDDVRAPSRRGEVRPHRCDHSYQTARDGSRCGNRAADKRSGGRL